MAGAPFHCLSICHPYVAHVVIPRFTCHTESPVICELYLIRLISQMDQILLLPSFILDRASDKRLLRHDLNSLRWPSTRSLLSAQYYCRYPPNVTLTKNGTFFVCKFLMLSLVHLSGSLDLGSGRVRDGEALFLRIMLSLFQGFGGVAS